MHLLIADDHPVFRKGLSFILAAGIDHCVLNECEDGKTALQIIRTHSPQVAVLDIDMPHMSGLEVCRVVNEEKLPTKIIILTMYKEREVLKKAMLYGAKGYIVKDNSGNEIVEGVNRVMAGDTFVGMGIHDDSGMYTILDKQKESIRTALQSLTQAEMKTLKLVSKQLPSKEIADLLFVSVKSVENYRSRICKKLNLDARNNSLLHWVLENKEVLDSISE